MIGGVQFNAELVIGLQQARDSMRDAGSGSSIGDEGFAIRDEGFAIQPSDFLTRATASVR